MNATPMCPTHSKPMRIGPRGNWYCPTSLGTDAAGNKLWCQHKAPRSAEQTNPTPSVATNGVSAAPTSPSSSLAIAALAFAGDVYRGAGPVGDAEALDLAVRAFETFTARMAS